MTFAIVLSFVIGNIHGQQSGIAVNTDGPVWIIQGKQDIVRPSTAEEAYQAFPNSRIVYMDHCIHNGWPDNPEVYFGEVIRFLL